MGDSPDNMRCARCGDGVLVPVDTESDTPLYRCNSCGYYYGDFMGRGHIMYYDTLHLKLMRLIDSENSMKGYFRVYVKKTADLENYVWTEVAKYIADALQDYDLPAITHGLEYLHNEGLLKTRLEDMDDVFVWFYVEVT